MAPLMYPEELLPYLAVWDDCEAMMQLRQTSFELGKLVAAGKVKRNIAKWFLLRLASLNDLSEREVKQAIEDGLDHGFWYRKAGFGTCRTT